MSRNPPSSAGVNPPIADPLESQLIATGIPLPFDMSPSERLRLAGELREVRRRELLRFLARAIALHLSRYRPKSVKE